MFDVDEGEKVVSVALLSESDDEQDEEITEVVPDNKDNGNEVEN